MEETLEDIPKKHFFYCCKSRTSCKPRVGPAFNFFSHEDFYDKNYHFSVSVINPVNEISGYICALSIVMEGDKLLFPPYSETIEFFDRNLVLGFLGAPFFLFDVGEIDIFYYHDTTTLFELNETLKLWLAPEKKQ